MKTKKGNWKHRWPLKSGGVGGGAAPPICKQNYPHSLPLVQTQMIHMAMTRCSFFNESIDGGDDLTLVLCCKHRWPLKARGVGGRRHPHLQTKGSAQNSPTANINDPHGDELMLVFLVQASMAFKSGGLGGAQPSPFANKMIRTAFP